jgi:hypothetical protein
MNITLKRTDEQVELIKAMASKNRNVAYEAQAAAAEFIGPVLSEVMNNAPSLSNLFTSFSFDEDDNASLPLDLYYDVTDSDYLEVWSQSVAGGLPSNAITPTHSELKFATYRLETAVDFDRRYAARSRLDVISKTFSRVAQELLIKQETTSANLVLGVLGAAMTNATSHVVASANKGQFILADVNSLMTRAKRINTAWNKGTPVSATKGVTDLLVSPEIMGEVRAMAYNPLNSRLGGGGGAVSVGAGEAINIPGGVVAGTESFRDALYNNAGATELYGIAITELNELGVDQRFNEVYKAQVSGNTGGDVGHDAGAAGTFDETAATGNEIVIGIDRGRDSLMRAVSVAGDSNSELRLIADDQYSVRQNKIGYYGTIEEGRVVLDSRAVTGIIV